MDGAAPIVVIAQNLELHEIPVQEPDAPIAIDVWHEYIQVRSTAVRRRWGKRTLLDHKYLISEGGQPKKSGRKKGEGKNTMEGELYSLLLNPLNKINTPLVRLWLEDNQHRPARANFAFVRLRAFLNWCARHDKYKCFVHSDACEKNKDFVPESRPAVAVFFKLVVIFFLYAACFVSTSFTGFKVTAPTGRQFRTEREPQR